MKKGHFLYRLARRTGIALGALLLLWMISIQVGCFSFRTPDAEWSAKFENKGQALPPRFVNVAGPDGRSIHTAYVSKRADLPLLVFVHGSPGSSDNFWRFMADTALSNKVQMASLDRPGFGYTENFGTAEGSLLVQAQAVKAVVDFLSPNRPALLLGHSLGAPVIARFAMEYPNQTAGIVLLGGSIDPELEPNNWWEPVVANPPVRWIMPKAVVASNDEIMALEQELEQMVPLWEKVQCPVLVLHATNDRLVDVGNVDFVKEMLPDSTRLVSWVYPEGDHFFLWTNPSKVLIPLNQFMDQIFLIDETHALD